MARSGKLPGGPRDVRPLAATVRRRLLIDMLAKAEAGSAPHAEALVRLSMEAERANEAQHDGARAA